MNIIGKYQFLSMSLLYDLKYINISDGKCNLFHTVKTLHECDSIDRKLLLYPLSELKKETGIGFDVIQQIMTFGGGDWLILLSNTIDIARLPFYIVLLLVKNHFDIAGLIEKNEAIDVNTLKTNPYV